MYRGPLTRPPAWVETVRKSGSVGVIVGFDPSMDDPDMLGDLRALAEKGLLLAAYCDADTGGHRCEPVVPPATTLTLAGQIGRPRRRNSAGQESRCRLRSAMSLRVSSLPRMSCMRC